MASMQLFANLSLTNSSPDKIIISLRVCLGKPLCKIFRIQQYGKRPVVYQRNFHICTKDSGLYIRNFFFAFCNNIFVEIVASSGFPALIKDGRFPFRQSAYNVNCDINNREPSISCKDRFVFPFSSPKMRIPRSFRIILSAMFLVSVSAIPIRTQKPFVICPVIFDQLHMLLQ